VPVKGNTGSNRVFTTVPHNAHSNYVPIKLPGFENYLSSNGEYFEPE